MSGPLELYRTTVNLRGLGSGTVVEIDPSDPGWAGDIAAKRVVPVNRAVSETYLTDDEPEVEVGAGLREYSIPPDLTAPDAPWVFADRVGSDAEHS